VLEFCVGLVNEDDRFRGMYEFSLWYNQLLKREGHPEHFKKSEFF
jgi:hypothetical protein